MEDRVSKLEAVLNTLNLITINGESNIVNMYCVYGMLKQIIEESKTEQ